MLKKLLLSVAASLLWMAMPINASAAECTLYEQSHPAFLLSGAHLSNGKCSTCASCHRSGVFVGTPKSCVACHNGDPARVTVGRSSAHIPTQIVECSNCHTTTLFTTQVNMDHTVVTGQRCDTCHEGSYTNYGKNFGGAKAKPSTHIPTTADCGSCHTTQSWLTNHATIHMGVTTGCVTCHNGTYAPGKSSYAAGHPVTSDACETCHSIDNAFKCASAYDKAVEFFAQLVNKAKVYSGAIFA